jgi:hypothetical protein
MASIYVGGGKYFPVYVHRFITECPPHLVVDHADHDTANNLRSNLRIASLSQNRANRLVDPATSAIYRGVSEHNPGQPRPFVAACIKDGRRHFSRHFESAEEAAREYDRMALELHGEFAVLNFPSAAAEPEGAVA